MLETVLVKPAGPDCDLACRYCFYRDKAALFSGDGPHRMADDVLEALVAQVMEQSGPRVAFVWQGGEPTLAGLPFFRQVVALQRRHGRGKTVGNALQTNGRRLTDEWVRFLRAHRFLVGLSLDGPEVVHDAYRRRADGAGTWRLVVERARRLLAAGVSTNVLTVVSDVAARSPRDIYAAHKALGLRWMQFVPAVDPDPAGGGGLAPWSVSASDYGRFLRELFDAWWADFRGGRPTTSVRLFDALVHRCAGRTPPACTLLSECGVYLAVEHDGSVYPCDFYVTPEWRLGHVLRDRLAALLTGARQREFGRRKARLGERCAACRWLALCRGGCPKDRLPTDAANAHNHLCEGYAAFFEHAAPRLREAAERLLPPG